MTTGATGQLGLALPVQGELSGTWGDTVNNGITQYTNIAIAATLTLTNDGAVTLANTTGDASASNITSSLTGAGTVTAQFAIVKVTGTLTTAKVITAPSYSKTYVVVNAATGGTVTFKASGQTGVSIAVGESAWVYYNGTDYVKIAGTTSGSAGGSNTQVQFNSSGSLAGDADLTFDGTTLSTAGLTASGTVTLSGGTANGVTYLNGSKVLTSGSALTFDGATLGNSTSGTPLSLNRTGAGTALIELKQSGTIGSYLGTSGSSDFIIFNGSAAELARFNGTGLGIGTSSPAYKLDVDGVAIIRNNVFSTGAFIPAANVSAPTADASMYRAADNTLAFATSSTERMRLDSAGNLGLGVTPSAWATIVPAMQIGNSSYATYSNRVYIGSNWYYNAGDKYIASDYASLYQQASGKHTWYTAPSGTAGNAITFTQAMTLDASGNLLVGTTSASGVLTLEGANTSDGATAKYIANIRNSGAQTSGIGAGIAFTQKMSSFYAVLSTIQGIKENATSDNYASALSFYTRVNGADLTERARIDSSGNLLVGTTATAAAKLTIVSTTNPALTLPNIAEIATVSATAATGTINYDLTTQSVLYYTTNASGNFTMNIRGNSGLSLNSMMSTGQSVTMAFLCTNGATAYYQSAMTIDGSSVTPKWQGGTAPTTGNASAIDSYVYTIIKTASATFTVLASQTKFA